MESIMDLPYHISQLITEDPDILLEATEYKSAVAVVYYRDKWLLGLAQNTYDDRSGKWCNVGGGMKSGETPEKAAVRECFEEAGIRVKAVQKLPDERDKPGVAFILCRAQNYDQTKLKPNHEFAAMGWFNSKDMRGIKLYNNIKRLISKGNRAK